MVNLITTFEPTDTRMIDETKPIDISNCVNCEHDSPALKDFQSDLFRSRTDLLFLITRNKNDNTVVYEMNRSSDGSLEESNVVHGVWQKFADHPGVTDWSKIEKPLNWIEGKVAYGVSSTRTQAVYEVKPSMQTRNSFVSCVSEDSDESPHKEKCSICPSRVVKREISEKPVKPIIPEKEKSDKISSPYTSTNFEVHLVALPSKTLQLVVDRFGKFRLLGTLGGRLCFLLRVYVHARERSFGLPTVEFLNVHGLSIDEGHEIVEKIKP